MAFLSIIRRWHKRDHVPIREISRRTGVSRNTIRKYLRSDVIEPKFQVLDRPSKLDAHAEKLSAWLRREAGRPRKQRRTAKQLYRDLVGLGYDGSYNRVAAFARAWQGKVLSYVDVGRQGGARLAMGGGVPQGYEQGAYVEPTLFTGVTNDMRIAREEIFGPVGAVIPFGTLDEAITIANDSIYGLAAGIWTSDLGTAHKMARDIEAGVIWVNCYDQGDMTQPWGGFKQSGTGRDKCLETLLTVTQTKSVWMNLS